MTKTYSQFTERKMSKFPPSLINKIAKMVDINDHNEAYITVANQLQKAGNNSGNQYAKRFDTIRANSDKIGHLAPHLSKLRSGFLKSMKDEVFRTFTNAEDVWAAL